MSNCPNRLAKLPLRTAVPCIILSFLIGNLIAGIDVTPVPRGVIPLGF
ncbi:MAG: hypothetical protein IH621_01685 [Krumholzibacteria bacterium]|nr:hypothetical protein [Candidatus Krumholzibacteria bacterium]